MALALHTLARVDAAGRRIAVLGDMGELGASAEQAHADAGRLAAELGIDWLFALGAGAEVVAGGARAAGMPAEHVYASTSFEKLCARLLEVAARGDWVLVKGSRAMRMERIASALEEQELA
jgi:UDP-N-acetylmuramoyl-tripeptide--D-alanyl-D-alanine ligase